jgi:uncharacterized LabA/DUF88 family protein
MNNYAFIDGQNLFLGTKSADTPWEIDLFKFRRYLSEKYSVDKAYYYIGYVQNKNQNLYNLIQEAGFILQFRQHNSAMKGKKKGNVDSDIIFDVMKKIYKLEAFDKILLISGDGDYKSLVDFLIEESRFKKILFPNQKYASSLYKDMSRKYFDNLDKNDLKNKIRRK